MDYATLTDLKTHLHISSSTDDTLLGDLLTRASRIIDSWCGRQFSSRTEVRSFPPAAVAANLLLLDDDLLNVVEIENGDGTTISPTEVLLRPLNMPPYFGIALKQGSGKCWAFEQDGRIAVEGVWGYSATPPEPVVQATILLAAWLYRRPDHDAGGELPTEVMALLRSYLRLRIKQGGAR